MILNKITIQIPSGKNSIMDPYFWNNRKSNIRPDISNELTKQDIKYKIYKILIFDELIFNINFCEIKWEEVDKKFYGVVIKEELKLVFFASPLKFTGKKWVTASRNTYILQNYKSSINYAKENQIKKISVSKNPFDLELPLITTNFIELNKREFLTLDISINKSLVKKPIKKFNSLEEYVNNRKSIKKSEKINKNSIKFEIEKNELNVYAKLTKGVTNVENIVACKLISMINKNNFVLNFYEIQDEKILNKQKGMRIFLEEMFFNVYDNVSINDELLNLLKSTNLGIQDCELKRNQNIFKSFIIKKYGDFIDVDKCFACSYNLPFLIASHIHRFADIKKDLKDKKINLDEAKKLIVSGDNGFLLCPNHDKEFEEGYIIFDYIDRKFKANFDKLGKIYNDDYYREKKILEIKSNIKNKDFEKNLINSKFIENLKKHIRRIGV